MKESQDKIIPNNECQHPADCCEVETLGYMDYYAGDVFDSLRQVLICKECGAVLLPEDSLVEEIPY